MPLRARSSARAEGLDTSEGGGVVGAAAFDVPGYVPGARGGRFQCALPFASWQHWRGAEDLAGGGWPSPGLGV